jgi:ketosteroid isomerase-like protein
MNSLQSTVLAAAIVTGCIVAPVAARSAPADAAMIRALEDKFVAAFNAKDVDAIMKVYVPDETLFVFDVTPPRQYVGAKAYRKDWEEFFSVFNGKPKFAITDLDVVAVGTIAYSHSIQHVSGTDTKSKPIDFTVRVTDVYRKIKGNWLVVQEHVSVPVDFDTGKPDMSSKP